MGAALHHQTAGTASSSMHRHSQGPPKVIAISFCAQKREQQQPVRIAAHDPAHRHQYYAAAPLDELWTLDGHDLLYTFGTRNGEYDGTPYQRAKVRKCFSIIQKSANIRFEMCDKEDRDVKIRITFQRSGQTQSLVGNVAEERAKREPTMNFHAIESQVRESTPKERRYILHELCHALGMIHEHQIAGGTIDMSASAQAAYRTRFLELGWTSDLIDEQVFRLYKEDEYSSFSPDVQSIMNYDFLYDLCGQPLPFRDELSTLDKAWLTINYPRTLHREVADGVTDQLKNALAAVGVDEQTMIGILDVQSSASEGSECDMRKIRDLFKDWNRARQIEAEQQSAPTAVDRAPTTLVHSSSPAPQTTHVLPISKQVFAYAHEDPFPCSYRRARPADSVPITGAASAVVHSDVFERRPCLRRRDGDSVAKKKISWTIVQDPYRDFNRRLVNRLPTQWEFDAVQNALDRWAAVTSFTFVEVPPFASADLVIVFQDINPIDGKWYDADDSANRSYCLYRRWTDANVEASTQLLGRIQHWVRTEREEVALQIGTKWTDDQLEDAKTPQVPHDVCFRGIVTPKMVNARPSAPGRRRPIDRSTRTMVHELGHFLGLAHEDSGYWCRMIEDATDAELREAAEDPNVVPTMLDLASVMDSLRFDDRHREARGSREQPFTAVFSPSPVDLANLALFHAGPHLASGQHTNGGPETATPGQQVGSLVAELGRTLGIEAQRVAKLESLAELGQWAALRDQYIAAARQRARTHYLYFYRLEMLTASSSRSGAGTPIEAVTRPVLTATQSGSSLKDSSQVGLSILRSSQRQMLPVDKSVDTYKVERGAPSFEGLREQLISRLGVLDRGQEFTSLCQPTMPVQGSTVGANPESSLSRGAVLYDLFEPHPVVTSRREGNLLEMYQGLLKHVTVTDRYAYRDLHAKLYVFGTISEFPSLLPQRYTADARILLDQINVWRGQRTEEQIRAAPNDISNKLYALEALLKECVGVPMTQDTLVQMPEPGRSRYLALVGDIKKAAWAVWQATTPSKRNHSLKLKEASVMYLDASLAAEARYKNESDELNCDAATRLANAEHWDDVVWDDIRFIEARYNNPAKHASA